MGWVYEREKKRNVDSRLRRHKCLLFLYQSNQCSPCKASLSVVAGCWPGTFVGLKKLSHQSTETTKNNRRCINQGNGNFAFSKWTAHVKIRQSLFQFSPIGKSEERERGESRTVIWEGSCESSNRCMNNIKINRGFGLVNGQVFRPSSIFVLLLP